jgi:hypothetical protein
MEEFTDNSEDIPLDLIGEYFRIYCKILHGILAESEGLKSRIKALEMRVKSLENSSKNCRGI